MDKITINSCGKINLSLDVLNKRKDGYHEINTIMQEINLKDTLIIKDIQKGIKIECDNPQVPLDSSNLVYKAYEKLVQKFNIQRGAYIIIQKNIPVASGLAGGSTDAAATLKGLNELWKLKLSDEELMKIGVEIGADIPFCIKGGTALASGIGEKLKMLNNFSNKYLLLANPGISISTSYVYNNLKLNKIRKHPDTYKLVEAIQDNDLYVVSKNMVNVLEQVTIEKFKIIRSIKEDMINFGAIGSLMSGSGPTVFGIFDNKKDLIKCKEELSKKIKIVITSKTM